MLAIRFRIAGKLRFLSHAETVKLFQRACVRAGMQLQYSQGYNPRPKMSLPLPRAVGVEPDEELLCLRLYRQPDQLSAVDYQSQVKAKLSAQLPDCCEVLSVSLAEPGSSFRPYLATYIVPVQQEYLNDRLRANIEHLLASESLKVRRASCVLRCA